jgi:(p)ppGpp synthase/HD superfamily hydrolase
MVEKARQFAVTHHGDQRYGERPYAYHLDQVASLLEPYGETARVVGYLHDVVEDTDVTLQQVAEEFGSAVAACVAVLTDEPGANRKERKEKTYTKMAGITGEAELALIVKAADRLANTQACLGDGKVDLLKVYQSELDAFYKAAYRKGLCDDLWSRLREVTYA